MFVCVSLSVCTFMKDVWSFQQSGDKIESKVIINTSGGITYDKEI